MKRKTGDSQLIRNLNQFNILEVIRKNGPISRSDIAKQLQISPTTVTTAINNLMKDEEVLEVGSGESSGGRRPILLKFNPNNKFIIGISLTNSTIKISKMDLEGKILLKDEHRLGRIQGNDVINRLLAITEEFLKIINNLEKCEGISIITPGIVNAEKGIITHNTKLKFFNIPLKVIFEKAFRLPTIIDNDVNSFVLAENIFGEFRRYRDLLYITIGGGVGSGIMINGNIFRGYSGSAGELGHTMSVKSGLKCECGNEGCLENYISWPAIYSLLVSAIVTRRSDTIIYELIEGDLNRLTPNVFIQALEKMTF